MIVVLSLCPLIFGMALWRNRHDLNKPEVKEKIGAMYTGLNALKPKSGLYCVVFLLRRSAFVVTTFTLYHYP